MQLHATCVCLEGRGVLLMGPPDSGKSDLALRLIDSGAQLVADDQVVLCNWNSQLIASPPERLGGLLEARGIGILKLSFMQEVPVALVIELVSRDVVERLPEPRVFDCLDVQVPLLSFYAFDASTPAKIRLYLRQE